MFSRRHPYLFSLLVLAALGTVASVCVSIMVTVVVGEQIDYSGEKVGVIEIVGAIVDSQTIVRQIKTFREKKD
ncbi:MAG: signal peptide peptidase SppA, partial [Desulfatitalea sp.]|nr:signal peptide peptidase SppA [Desulfatitalea sp.]NNJ99936.1 signal peptide peptidase SppA [Desulfatitalea sp.]